MTCESCLKAEQNPRTGYFSNGCDECNARAIANGMELFEASKAGRFTERYKKALIAVFGADWEAGHLRVKHWAKRIKDNK